MKKVKWVIILLVIVCMFFLFELKVYASEDEIANIMKKIPDTIELNDSTEMTNWLRYRFQRNMNLEFSRGIIIGVRK